MSTPEALGYIRKQPFHSHLEAVKEAVPVIDLADLLCGPAGNRSGMRRIAERWVARCPLPDHQDKTPSFTIYPNDDQGQGRWHCFGCNRGGDVVDLYQLVHAYETPREAVAWLAAEMGVELPARSQAWYRARKRRQKYLDRHAKTGGYRLARRLFRILELPPIKAMFPPEEQEAEIARSWAAWYDDPGLWAHYWSNLVHPRLAEAKPDGEAGP